MPRRDLKGCRAIVTGASRGIGRELALALARQGVRILATARDEGRLRELADECARLERFTGWCAAKCATGVSPVSSGYSLGTSALAKRQWHTNRQNALAGDADFLAGDIADAAHRQALVDRATARWGGLDLLVNNAGVSAHGRFADGDDATLRRIMEVNFFAATDLTRRALPALVHGRDAAIVNVGSILGRRGAPLNSEYSASKFALCGWSEALRAELAEQGIDVLLVSPGTVQTEFFEHLLAQREALPWGAARGVAAEVVAERTVRALVRRRREIFPNWRGRALALANRLAPGAVDRAMARLARRRP